MTRDFDPPTYDTLQAASGLPRIEARRLLEVASGRSREWLIAHGDEATSAPVREHYVSLCRRRRDGEPIAYLSGAREFRGRDFLVGPDVLIPRPETELLVDLAIGQCPPNARVIDLGTGSGCIAVTLAVERQDLQVLATDCSEPALCRATSNARLLCPQALAGERLRLRPSNWWSGVDSSERFEVVVSNPPYIAANDPHLRQGDLRFEPASALTDGGDGLVALRAVVSGARSHLVDGGRLLVEHGYDQERAVRALLDTFGFGDVVCHRDAAGLPRVTSATLTLTEQGS